MILLSNGFPLGQGGRNGKKQIGIRSFLQCRCSGFADGSADKQLLCILLHCCWNGDSLSAFCRTQTMKPMTEAGVSQNDMWLSKNGFGNF